MNKDAISTIAHLLEKEATIRSSGGEIGFDMESYIDTTNEKFSCGTSACIAGWAVALFNDDGSPRTAPLTGEELVAIDETEVPDSVYASIFDKAQQIFGINDNAAYRLFTPAALEVIDAKMAAETLRKLAETGEVEWDEDEIERRFGALVEKRGW